MPASPSELTLPARRPLPIVLLSCKRPHYFQQVLASLRPQIGEQDEIYLFQDGGRNPHSGRGVSAEQVVDHCVALFSHAFPQGRVYRSPDNLGIAGNYRRAERYVFEVLNRPYALFLEDDMILAPNYLDVISDLVGLALENPRIGYVSAYGDFWASLAEQRAASGRFLQMHENWGAALTRASWEEQKPIRERYWQIVGAFDYKFRDQRAILDLYQQLGYKCSHTTQDASRWVATYAAGMVRLTTATCHARYIGAVGEHSDNSFFHRCRFEEAVMCPDRTALPMPSKEQIELWLRADGERFAQGYIHSYLQGEKLSAA
jgi:hypothetical protein